MIDGFITTTAAADMLGTKLWRIRELFEDRVVAEPPRYGPYRMIDRAKLLELHDALVDRGAISPRPAIEALRDDVDPVATTIEGGRDADDRD